MSDDVGDAVDRAEVVLARARALAESPLEGINEAALELAALSGGERSVIEQARRRVEAEVGEAGSSVAKQMASLIRRALELGEWPWSAEEMTRTIDSFGRRRTG